MASYIGDHIPVKGNRYLFDTNVFMKLFSLGKMDVNSYNASDYSRFYYSILNCKDVEILLPYIVINEMANAHLRYRYKESFEDIGYKKFRRTDAYKDEMEILSIIVKKQLSRMKRISDGFDVLDTDIIFLSGNIDLNDRYLASLAKDHDCYFVTDDLDFDSVKGLKILTGNKKLLRRS